MVGTPLRRHSSRHRRVASILAQRAIQDISPIRPAERRAERRRRERARERRRDAEFYRGLLAYCGVPQQPARRRRRVGPQRPQVVQPVILSSDTSGDDQPDPQQQRPVVVVDLDSSIESLPNIDPRPQWQLPVEQLVDLGPLNVTQELLPPLQHRVLTEAYVLLQHLQLPALQHITPPPELPPRAPTPPPEEEEQWRTLEVELERLDNNSYALTVTEPLALQQPQVEPVPEHVPAAHVQPQPMPAVDWALVAHALFTVAEAEYRQREN